MMNLCIDHYLFKARNHLDFQRRRLSKLQLIQISKLPMTQCFLRDQDDTWNLCKGPRKHNLDQEYFLNKKNREFSMVALFLSDPQESMNFCGGPTYT
jgi:hypothetical protein